MNSSRVLFLLFFYLCVPAAAHDYWLKPLKSGVELVYGHDKESESYQRSVLKSLTAYDKQGKALAGKPTFFQDTFRLQVPGAASYLAVVDDGPWVKTVRGWKRGLKKDHSGVVSSTWDRYYAKFSSDKSPPLGQTLEIVVDDLKGRVSGQVLFQGQPLQNTTLEVNHKKVGKTDAQGRFSLAESAANPLIIRVAHKEKGTGGVDWAQHISTLTLLQK